MTAARTARIERLIDSIMHEATKDLAARIWELEQQASALRDALALADRTPLSEVESAVGVFTARDGYACGECGSNVYAQEEAHRAHLALKAWTDTERIDR